MANKYCNLKGYNKVSDEYGLINTGFDKVDQDVSELQTEVKEIVKGDANAEVGQAHVSTAKGKVFETIKDRFEEIEEDVSVNLMTASLSLSAADSVKSVTANVASVPKVKIVAPDMLVNMLGRDGDFEDGNKLTLAGAVTLDATRKMFGLKSLKCAGNASSGAYAHKDINDNGLNYYFLSAYAYVTVNDAGDFGITVYDKGGWTNSKVVVADKTKLNVWQRIGIKAAKTDGLRALFGRSNVGLAEGYIDGGIVYKITADEYNSLTIDQLLAKYPYANSVQPTLNPCVTVRGRNLFDRNDLLNGYYNSTNGVFVAHANYKVNRIPIKIKANVNYYNNSNTYAVIFDRQGNYKTYINNRIISVPYDALVYQNVDITTKDVNIVQFEEGTAETPYEEYREKQRIYPCTLAKVSTYADELTDDGIKATKTWRVKRVPVEVTFFGTSTNINYAYMSKPTDCVPLVAAVQPEIFVPTKIQYPDATFFALPADSPYIGNYLTTAGGGGLIYFVFSKAITTLEQAKAELAGLELWYALATPEQEIIEPIGSLRLEQGYNCIDVSTGIVYERANPVLVVADNSYVINKLSVVKSILGYKTNNILALFRDKALDNNWIIGKDSPSYYGGGYAYVSAAKHDSTADYKIKYEVLHEDYDSQQVSVTLEYADNLRTSHNQLVENVASLESEVNDVWFALLPIADKEIAMQKIALLTTETTADLKAKVNEILNVWR